MPFDLSEDQLKGTETEIGAAFPDSYRRLMMQSNGGEIAANSDIWNLIPIRDTSDRKRLSRTSSNVVTETKSFAEFPEWHENAYAIAENGSGDALVMLQDGDRFKQQIFYWCHEDGALDLVAEDFLVLANDR